MFESLKNVFSKIFSPTKNSNEDVKDETFKPNLSSNKRQRVSFDPHISQTHFKQPVNMDTSINDQYSNFNRTSNNESLFLNQRNRSMHNTSINNFSHQRNDFSNKICNEYENSFKYNSKRAKIENSFNTEHQQRSYFGKNTSKNEASFSQNNFNLSNRSNRHGVSLVQASPAKEILKRLTEMAENSHTMNYNFKKRQTTSTRHKKSSHASKLFSLPQNSRTRLSQMSTVSKTKHQQLQRQNSGANLKTLKSENDSKKFAFSYQPITFSDALSTDTPSAKANLVSKNIINKKSDQEKSMWKCQICCFQNDDSDNNCVACDTLRPGKSNLFEKKPLLSQPASFTINKNDKSESVKSVPVPSNIPMQSTIKVSNNAAENAIDLPAQSSSGFEFKIPSKEENSKTKPNETNDSFKFASSNLSNSNISAYPIDNFSFDKSKKDSNDEKIESDDDDDDGFVGGFSLAGASTENWSKNEGALKADDDKKTSVNLSSDHNNSSSQTEPKLNPFSSNVNNASQEKASTNQSPFSFNPVSKSNSETLKFAFSLPKSDTNSTGFNFTSSDQKKDSTGGFSFNAKLPEDSKSSPSFSFENKSADMKSQSQETKPPAFSFDLPKSSEASNEISKPSEFSFGNFNSAPNNTSGFSFTQKTNDVSDKPTNLFSFKDSNSNSNNPLISSNKDKNSESNKPEVSLFNFTSTTSTTDASKPQPSSFNFGSSQTSNIFNANSKVNETNNFNKSSNNLFSNTNATQNNSNVTNIFSSFNQAKTPFGNADSSIGGTANIFAKKSSDSSNITPNLFQTNATNNSSFSFNSQNTQPNANTNPDQGNNMFNTNQRLIRKAYRRM